jgi:hypothetical protein
MIIEGPCPPGARESPRPKAKRPRRPGCRFAAVLEIPRLLRPIPPSEPQSLRERKNKTTSTMSDDPFQKAYSDVEPWRILWRYLEKGLQSLPTTDWVPKFPDAEASQAADREKTAIREAILELARDTAPVIGQAIDQYSKGQCWPEMSPECVYFLQLMHTAALDFVGRLGANSPIGPKPL